MQTWMIMMGIQMTIFIICAVWVGIWMNKKDDEYDEALARLEKARFEKMQGQQSQQQ